MAEKLKPQEIEEKIARLDGWRFDASRHVLEKSFTFKNFSQAFAWMTRLALWAEKVNHHPDWRNIYRQVDISLTTHDCDGVSEKDIEMAKKMDLYAKNNQ